MYKRAAEELDPGPSGHIKVVQVIDFNKRRCMGAKPCVKTVRSPCSDATKKTKLCRGYLYDFYSFWGFV